MECLPWMEGGVWQQILWRAVRVGDLVHTECFRGISWSSLPAVLESGFGSVLQCADWFLLVGLNWKVSSRSTPKKVFSWRATQEPSKAQRHQARWVLGVSSLCRFAAAVLCSWLTRAEFELTRSHLDLPWQELTLLGWELMPALISKLVIFPEGKAPEISSVFSDTLTFQYSCFQFRCFREEEGKRRGKCQISPSFSSTAKHNSSNFAWWIFEASKEVLHHHQEC